jgi:hypothetical protein
MELPFGQFLMGKISLLLFILALISTEAGEPLFFSISLWVT